MNTGSVYRAQLRRSLAGPDLLVWSCLCSAFVKETALHGDSYHRNPLLFVASLSQYAVYVHRYF